MTRKCQEIREDILRISNESGHGHIPSCFSIVEILYAIYCTIKHNPKNPEWDERDMFILSKGHAALAHYCILSAFGYFEKERIRTFGAHLSDFGCHADRLKVPGIEASTGSLGHGIGLAVGMALGLRIDGRKRRVLALIGDGEANEGSVWEAVLAAVSLKLNNLTIIYDNNMSHSRGLQIHNPGRHFRGFGCDVVEIDGHNLDAIRGELCNKSDTVKIIIGNTVKGYGCKTFIENQHEWHRKSPDNQEMAMLLKEVCEATV